jgi:CPA2 family monovalent cation:H+ antiporter-2
VGMQINFSIIAEYFLIILVLLPILILVKYVIIYTIVRIDDTKRVAFKTAISLVQIGEFSLAVLELARNNHLIDPTNSQILIVTIVISMILTPLVLKNLSRMAATIIPEDSMIVCNALQVDEDTKDHIIVLGYGNLGQEVVKELKKENKEYFIIEHNLKYFEEGKEHNEPILFGNAVHKHILESVKIKRASAIIVAIDNPEKLHLICEVIDDLTKNIKTIVKVIKCSEKESLAQLHLKHIIVQNSEVARALVKETYTV